MDKFINIFRGLTIAYGQYQKGENNGEAKQKGKAFIVVSIPRTLESLDDVMSAMNIAKG